MIKRGLAVVLAVVLAFTPVAQVGATGVSTVQTEVAEDIVSENEIAEGTEVTEESEVSEEGVSEEESSLEETLESEEAESSVEEESTETAQSTEETTEEITETETETTPETTMEETTVEETTVELSVSGAEIATSDVVTQMSTTEVLTEDIDLTASAEDASGTGWTWQASTGTFTMNGYHSTGQISLPAGAMVVLAKGSTNTIDTCESGKYGIYASGNLTITGDGKLTVKYLDKYSVYTKEVLTFLDTNVHFVNTAGSARPFYLHWDGTRILCSNITIETSDERAISTYYLSYEECTLVKGSLVSGEYSGVLNSETGLYEFVFEKNPIYIVQQPEKINELYVGDTVKLQILGRAVDGSAVKYQWYRATDFENPKNGAVKLNKATSPNYTVTGTERGIQYYYCEVTSGENSVITNVVAVVTGNVGTKICTEKISFATATDNLDTDGWKWDPDTYTITFNNIDLLIPFPENYTNVQIRSGYTVVLEGNNYFDNNDGQFTLINSSQVGKITTITGPGTMWLDRVYTGYLDDDAEVHFTGGLTMHVEEFDNNKGKVILDNVTVKTREETPIWSNDMTLQNGAYLENAGKVEVKTDINVGEGCTLIAGEGIICSGNLTIGKGAKVFINGCLDMDATSSSTNLSRVLTINGMLSVKDSTYKPIYFYSQTETPLVLGENINVLYPEGATWTRNSSSSYYYGFVYNGSSSLESLVIGEALLDTKEITGSTKVTGTAKYGHVLTAGEVTPADAPVSYQWQYAASANGPWSDIYNAKAKCYTVETKYANYFLRVVTKGMGEYTGTITSNPVGPVEGNPATLTGIWYSGGTVQSEQIGGTPFNGNSTSYSTSSDMTEEGTVSYVTIPVRGDAKVTIRNATTGFEQVGTTADVPMQTGSNQIEIEVSYGTKNTVYKISHTIKDMYYDLDLSCGSSSSAVSLTATWTDENGEIQSMTDEDAYATIKAGTEITVTSTVDTGTYPFMYEGLDAVPDKTKAGFPATFVIDEDTDIAIRSSCIMAYPPEELTARWKLTDGSAEIAVKALPIPDTAPAEYVGTYVWVTDSDNNFVRDYTFDGEANLPEADGYYRFEILNNLDSTKEYTVQAKYVDIVNDNVSQEQQTACFTLEKRGPVTLTPKSEYVVLKPGETAEIPIIYEGYTGSELVLESGYDTAVVSESGTKIITDASGNRILMVGASEKSGTTYLTLRGEDYENEEGMQYVFASVRVDVSSQDEASALNLGVTKGTLNLCDDSTLTIPVYQMECGHDIEGAEFVETVLNEKFAIEVVNDRTIKIIPKIPEDEGTIDYAKWLKQEGVTGTFLSKIKVNYNGAASRESTEELQITLTAKLPKVKVSSLAFNSFYTQESKDLQVTVKGERVSRVEVDTAKNVGDTVACPDWLSVNEEDGSVVFDGKDISANKVKANLYLKVWLDGYRIPVQTKIKAEATYKVPKLKFKQSTVTVSKNIVDIPYTQLQLVSGDKKVKLETIGVESLQLMSYTEYLNLSSKNKKSHVSPLLFYIDDYDTETGVLILEHTATPTKGKVVLYANIQNGKQPIKLTFNLKVQESPTIKLSKKSITMDAIFGSYPLDDMQFVKISSSLSGYPIGDGNISFKVTMVGDKTNADYSSHISTWWDGTEQAIRVYRNSSAIAGKSYKVTVSVDGIEKTASFTVKIKKSKEPAFKAATTSVTLNRMKSDATKIVKVTLPKKYGTGWYVGQIEVIKPDSTADDGTLGYERIYDDRGTVLGVRFRANASTQAGTYTVKVHGGLYGGAQIKPATIKVKVVDKFPNMSLPAVTLNKDLAGFDKATISLPVADGYFYDSGTPWEIASVADKKGNNVSDNLVCELTDNTLTVNSNELTGYNATYKLNLICKFAHEVEKQATITVKTAKKAPAISIKGKAKGSVDITRPDTTEAVINYTYTNWNEGYYADGLEPVLEWEVYAKNGKKNVTTANGALNDSGLVAKGNSISALPQEGSWFINSGYTSETPYKLTFMINKDSEAYAGDLIAPQYTYTVKTTLSFDAMEQVVKASNVTFKVKQGTTKFVIDKKAVSLSKLDANGRALITLTDKDKDRFAVQDIAYVEVVSNKKVPVSDAIEIVPVYSANEKTTYAVYWKDKAVSDVKSGTVKIRIYLKGNNTAWKKPNATFNLKVNIK